MRRNRNPSTRPRSKRGRRCGRRCRRPTRRRRRCRPRGSPRLWRWRRRGRRRRRLLPRLWFQKLRLCPSRAGTRARMTPTPTMRKATSRRGGLGARRRRRPRKRRRGIAPRAHHLDPGPNPPERAARVVGGASATRPRARPTRKPVEACAGRRRARAARTTTRGRPRAPTVRGPNPNRTAAAAAGRARRYSRSRARTPGRAWGIKRPTHPCRRPRLVCPSAARPAAGPGWATPRRSWTWTRWTLILEATRCCLDQERRRRGPGRTSGRAVHRGGRRPGAGAIWGMVPRHLPYRRLQPDPFRRRRRPSCRLQWYRRRPRSPAGPGTCRPARRLPRTTRPSRGSSPSRAATSACRPSGRRRRRSESVRPPLTMSPAHRPSPSE